MNEREREEDERTEQIPREAPPRVVVVEDTREEWSILTPFSWFFGVI
jgi:hypothetical protein